MKAKARPIDEVLWRDLLQYRDMPNSAVSQIITPDPFHSLLETEQDNDATPCGAD